MKKLMIAAAIVCAAAMSQAASFTWKTTGNFTAKDGTVLTATTAPAGNIVLMYLGNGVDAKWENATVAIDKNGNDAIASVNYTVSMSTPSSKASTAFNFAANTAYKNGDVFGVMFRDGDGNLSYLKDQASGDDILATYTISGLTDDTSSLGAYTFASASFYAESVPEPTSGLLLLLGVAGLALKRRRA